MKSTTLMVACWTLLSWLAMAPWSPLALAHTQQPALPSQGTDILPFHCFGTEPFWTLDICSTQFRYHTPEPFNRLLAIVKPRHVKGMKSSYLQVYETHFTRSKSQRVSIIIKDNPQGCTDGMSEELHEYDAIVIMPDQVLAGCCNKGTG
ncbi:MAG: hypothetical protein A3F17_05340 [Gammaproteobacteria bacterium RIFCSPHIGHO2_12_FULL_41_15]|nr:MAG: hypothetical protein A3F17_05340 [Gammaproteobacteria bacterium RIFCSPHIGHO2_12_FULL_41_15]